jgi:IS30 family transposase
MQGMKKTNKLTAKERDLIAVWYGQKITIRQIAGRLKRNPSTISREIKRNGFKDKHDNQYYVAIHAQSCWQEKKSKAGKRQPLKNPKIYSYVLNKLRFGWSPEQIAGRLRKKYSKTLICHETIYRFIYSKKNQDKRLWEYLPLKRVKRRKKKGRKTKRIMIANRVSIHKRSKKIDKRKEFGHWEGDSIVGKNHKSAIHTEVERLSRYLLARKLTGFKPEETVDNQIKIFDNLPVKAKRSTTVDNGLEFANHLLLKKEVNMITYFADPYASWQRGTNEYHNGLLRRYLPKRTDFNTITQEELGDIVNEINSRPRKCLNYQTPKEVFKLQLNKAGVAIQL